MLRPALSLTTICVLRSVLVLWSLEDDEVFPDFLAYSVAAAEEVDPSAGGAIYPKMRRER